ncbi:30S ribosomal protein S12 methylthiotransferase RimO [bacterium]|nr:30S ribosomal protein S12 methylthiotransferase RimO [bacterium]
MYKTNDQRFKIGMISLGCSKNLVDSEVMLGLLKDDGHTITPNPDEAEVIIVNTCSFIESAKRESIDTILEMAIMKKKGRCVFLVVTGCMAEEYRRRLPGLIPEIDALAGTGEFKRIAQIIRELNQAPCQRISHFSDPANFLYDHSYTRLRTTWPHLAYIKIAEGCDNCCSYCLIPKLRGKYRSRQAESIQKEAESLIAEGVKEICLIAQDTTGFGKDSGNGFKISDLLDRLGRIKGSPWIRLLYAYPFTVDRDLIYAIAQNDNILPYLDIPLQHTAPRVLKAMNRPHDMERIEDIIRFARSAIPDIVIRTTFMVGFPGETESEFESMLRFIEKVRFDCLGAFMYSREKGTPAYNMPGQIPKRIKQKRYNKVMQMQAGISKGKNLSLIGRVMEVICDYPDNDRKGGMIGRTKGQAPEIDGATYITGKDIKPGDICKVKITNADVYDIEGVRV